MKITENILNFISLKNTTKGKDIFYGVENFLQKNNLSLEIVSEISTDGAPAMIDKENRAVKLLIDKI